MSIHLENITKSYNELKVVDRLSINFSQNNIHCFFGPSGCGKTTLLNIITGINPPDQGVIKGVKDKRFSYLFQEDRLFPWATAEANIRFVLESHYEKSEIQRRIDKYLKLVNLEDFRNHYPNHLSGGMKQRMAIARAFAYGGDVLVLDEPFKGLDLERKRILIDYISDYWKKQYELVFFITHDSEEAIYMADFIYIWRGPPLALQKVIKVAIPTEERYERQKEFKQYKDALDAF